MIHRPILRHDNISRDHVMTINIICFHGQQLVMTSPETTSVAKRRAMYGVVNDKTARHSIGTFTWSAGHVSVRDLIMRQLPEMVRISEGCHCERRPHRFNFHEGSVSTKIKRVTYRSIAVEKLVSCISSYFIKPAIRGNVDGI